MANWLTRLFSRNNKQKPLSLCKKLAALKAGDLVQVKLGADFSAYAKTQPLMRFTEAELDSRLIRGIVFFSNIRPDIGCYVLEIQTISTEYGDVRSKSVAILEDELEDVTKYA